MACVRSGLKDRSRAVESVLCVCVFTAGVSVGHSDCHARQLILRKACLHREREMLITQRQSCVSRDVIFLRSLDCVNLR